MRDRLHYGGGTVVLLSGLAYVAVTSLYFSFLDFQNVSDYSFTVSKTFWMMDPVVKMG